jgi:rhamnosyltransferase
MQNLDFENPKICGCVVLYHPDSSVLRNIQAYCLNVDKLYVVDNTEKEAASDVLYEALKEIKKIEVIPNFENRGIAAAINQAVNRAQEEKYDLVLTMDQDTFIAADHVKKMLMALKNNNIDIATVGIVSPYHKVFAEDVNSSPTEISDILVVMTSGNLLNIEAYSKSGPFLEKLFIDRVDCEYCLRLKTNGYRIVQVKSVTLNHPLGKVSVHTVFGKKYYPTNHSALRRYYMTRNGLYVADMYRDIFPAYLRWERVVFLSDLRMMIFFEKDRIEKLKMIFLGYFDYKRKLFGMYKN